MEINLGPTRVYIFKTFSKIIFNVWDRYSDDTELIISPDQARLIGLELLKAAEEAEIATKSP